MITIYMNAHQRVITDYMTAIRMLSMTIIDDMAHLYDYHLYGRTSVCDY